MIFVLGALALTPLVVIYVNETFGTPSERRWKQRQRESDEMAREWAKGSDNLLGDMSISQDQQNLIDSGRQRLESLRNKAAASNTSREP